MPTQDALLSALTANSRAFRLVRRSKRLVLTPQPATLRAQRGGMTLRQSCTSVSDVHEARGALTGVAYCGSRTRVPERDAIMGKREPRRPCG
jgi:hypothetical protein